MNKKATAEVQALHSILRPIEEKQAKVTRCFIRTSKNMLPNRSLPN